MIAFKIDENLPARAADLLRAAGHDALTVLEQKLGGRPDTTIAEACRSEKRALITLDLDFANIRSYPPEDYSGLVVLRLPRHDADLTLAVIESVIPVLGKETPEGALWIIEPGRMRIWSR